MKRFVSVVGTVFFLGLVVFYAPCRSYALNPQPLPPGLYPSKYIGTITNIAGNKITVMDDTGKVRTIESNVKGLKVGDKVKVTTRDGLTWLNPQPEPPMPEVKSQNAVTSTPEAPSPPPKTSPQLR